MTKSIEKLEKIERLLFTFQETAFALGVCERTARNLVARGELRAVRIGRSVRVPLEEIRRIAGGAELATEGAA